MHRRVSAMRQRRSRHGLHGTGLPQHTPVPHRTGACRIRRSEQRQDAGPQRRGNVHRPGVHRDHQVDAPQDCGQVLQGQPSDQRPRGRLQPLANGRSHRRIRPTASQEHTRALCPKRGRHGAPPLDLPQLGVPPGRRMQDDAGTRHIGKKRPGSFQVARVERDREVPHRFARIHCRRQGQIPLDRVDGLWRDRDPVRQRPASAFPGVRQPHPHRRAGRQDVERALEQALQVQHHVVPRPAHLTDEGPDFAQRGGNLARSPHLALPAPPPRHHEGRNRGMPLHERCRLLFDQPIEGDVRVAVLQGGDHRKRMNHIAQGARFDEQDPPRAVQPDRERTHPTVPTAGGARPPPT